MPLRSQGSHCNICCCQLFSCPRTSVPSAEAGVLIHSSFYFTSYSPAAVFLHSPLHYPLLTGRRYYLISICNPHMAQKRRRNQSSASLLNHLLAPVRAEGQVPLKGQLPERNNGDEKDCELRRPLRPLHCYREQRPSLPTLDDILFVIP